MLKFNACSGRSTGLAAALCAGLVSSLANAASAGAPADSPAVVGAAVAPSDSSAQWQEQKIKFTYDGITTLYTCDGLEDKVREILLVFGARKDAKVRATGCERGSNLPSRFAWVEATYDALMPAAESQGTVKSVWAPIQVAPNRPSFMGAGECELIEQMRDALSKGFTVRNVQYRASCVPHTVSLGSYSITAEALKAAVHVE